MTKLTLSLDLRELGNSAQGVGENALAIKAIDRIVLESRSDLDSRETA